MTVSGELCRVILPFCCVVVVALPFLATLEAIVHAYITPPYIPVIMGLLKHAIVVACPHPRLAAHIQHFFLSTFGTVIPTSFNILMEMFYTFYNVTITTAQLNDYIFIQLLECDHYCTCIGFVRALTSVL